MTQPTEKVCRKCGETKPRDAYYAVRTRDGRDSTCKACRCAEGRERYAANPERRAETNRAWYEANRERRLAKARAWQQANRERMTELMREWRSRNPERSAELTRQWREANKDRVRELGRNAYAANPERYIEREARRRARIAKTPVGDVNLESLWTGSCGICGELLDREVRYPDPMSKSLDHVVPLSRGGAHDQANLQWAHLACNVRKGARLPTAG